MATKQERLLALARRRQWAEPWPGSFRVADFHNGAFECDYVSPWTKSAHNVDSDVMLVGQDWASADRLAGPFDPEVSRLGHDKKIPTNRHLQRLLREHLQLEFANTYATNIFPFIKPGRLSAKILLNGLVAGARDYLLPQVEIVRPKLVVCLGLATFNAAREAIGQPRITPLSSAIGQPVTFRQSAIHAVAHTGAFGMLNRGRENVERDWAALGRLIREDLRQ